MYLLRLLAELVSSVIHNMKPKHLRIISVDSYQSRLLSAVVCSKTSCAFIAVGCSFSSYRFVFQQVSHPLSALSTSKKTDCQHQLMKFAG